MNLNQTVKATKKNVIGFAIGNVGSTLWFNFVSMYILFFYTNIMGVSVAVAGTVFMATRIVDAVSDPLMGVWADRMNSKIGKYRPFLIVGAPLTGISLVLMFFCPNLTPYGAVIYCYTTYVVGSLSRTVVDTPYHSIVTLLSPDPDERGRIITIKNLFALITTLLLAPVMNIIAALGNGVLAWRTLATIYALIVTVTYWICSSMIKDKDVHIESDAGHPREKVSVRKQLTAIVKNPAILLVIVSFATDSFAYQIINAVNAYYFLYNLHNRTDLIVWTQYPTILVSILLVFILKPFFQKFGKRVAFLGIEAILTIPCLALLLIDQNNIIGIMVILITAACLQVFAQNIVWSVLPDCADYAELHLGIQCSATVTSTFTFMNKMSQALGVFVSSQILAGLGFVSGAGTQSQVVMDSILRMRTLIPIAAYIISVIALSFYPIKRKDEVEMANRLSEIRMKELGVTEGSDNK
jgi:sugar (glycoside-pentoside-hexuronide) transporter